MAYSSQKLSNKTILLLFLLILTTIFNLVSAQHSHGKETKECICLKNDPDHDHDHEEESNNGSTIKYKVGAIIAILCASAFGVFLPILGKNIPGLRPDKSTFVIVKTFAAGVILCTALIHILPEAFESLTNPCIGEDSVVLSFPFTGVAVMVGALLTLIMDCLATRHFSNGDDEEDKDGNNVHHHVHGSASHAPLPTGLSRVEIIRYRVTSQVLEMGIVVHSVIIGIALGTSQDVETIKPLMAALCFHQFFEGVGLGGCIVQASFKSASMMCMALFFSLTTPVGIAIGIGITNVYDESSPTALIVQGLLDAVAAGILIYMALVDLLAQDFMNPKVHNNNRLFFGANVALLLGAGFMAVLAIWA